MSGWAADGLSHHPASLKPFGLVQEVPSPTLWHMNASPANCPACGRDLSLFPTLPASCPGCGVALSVSPVPPPLLPASAPGRPTLLAAFFALLLAPPLTMLWSLPHFKKDWPLQVVLAVTLPCASGAGFVRASYATSRQNIEIALERLQRFMRRHG